MLAAYQNIYTHAIDPERIPFPVPDDSPTLLMCERSKDTLADMSRIGRNVNYELFRLRLSPHSAQTSRTFIAKYLGEIMEALITLQHAMDPNEYPASCKIMATLMTLINKARTASENRSHRHTILMMDLASYAVLKQIELLRDASVVTESAVRSGASAPTTRAPTPTSIDSVATPE